VFVEKLSGAKSVDKAIEIQTEFAKSAFETFMAESQKIGALYRDLATESYKPFGGFLAKMTRQIDKSYPRDVSAKLPCSSRGFFVPRPRACPPTWRLHVQSNPPFQNLSLDPAEMIAVNGGLRSGDVNASEYRPTGSGIAKSSPGVFCKPQKPASGTPTNYASAPSMD
jgi:hypothetical protein